MKRVQRRRLLFAGWMLALAGFAAAEPVDPRFPSELQPIPAEDWSRWLPTRIEQLEAERDQLLEKISMLPQHAPVFSFDQLGYHSSVGDPASDEVLPPHQLVIKLPQIPPLASIALVPAFNPSESRIYAFPKRFKIEVMRPETGEFEPFVNWMDEDFSDPGLYPVFFSGLSNRVAQVRLTVPRLTQGTGDAYYALGEICLFRSREGERMGDNVMGWGTETIEVFDSFSMLPYWDQRYVHDGRTGFGLPLSDQLVESEDLMVTYEKGEPFADKVQITMDLGRLRPVGVVEFWPAAAPNRLALPSFGFPEKITVEISGTPGFKSAKVLEPANAGTRMYSGGLFSVIGEATLGRYVRITMEGLGKYQGRPFLGLGEILVSSNEEVWSTGCKVTAEGIPAEGLEQLPRLVDGSARQRRILLEGEWIKGLARRRPLDRRLTVVERELALAREAWRVLQFRISIWSGVLLGMILIFGRVFLKRQRRRVLNTLKLRITRDLHDDVGSNLGSISLTAEQLKRSVMDEKAREELDDLSLLASEACASLREVVWVIDESTIRLPGLIQKLVERAERVLGGMEVFVEISEACPDCVVSLTFKRHLIMFFKEVVHNCARHSQATQVWLAFSIVDKHLKLSVRDNGCGFDPAESSEGLGLDSIKKRASEMSGELELISRPGEGAVVNLTVPLTSLMSETDHLYKTSN